MCGTNGPPGSFDTEPSASTLNTNVATKVPSVSWVPKSRMKLRSIRGPNWVDASCSARIVIEKTTPTTVITAAAMEVRMVRAASGPPVFTHEGRLKSPLSTARSSRYVTANSRIALTTRMLGTNQRLVRSVSRRHPDSRSRA